MKLIICEKPSLASNVANAIGKVEKKNGYYLVKDYVISWAFGHLFVLKSVKDYLKVDKLSWNKIELPYIPEKFEFMLKDNQGVKKQFKILKEVIKTYEIDEIINCGDSDREGQIIIDTIISELNFNKKIMRLWLPEQTRDTILSSLKELKDNKEYKYLADEGYARMYLDWLLGVNYTTLVTIKKNKLMNIGRVMIPIINKIFERDLEIENFKPSKYFKLISLTKCKNIDVDEVFELPSEKDSKDIEIKLELKKQFSLEEKKELNDLIDELNSTEAIVTNIEKSISKKYPPKLFSLSKLQSYLSSKYKISFEDSLKTIQELYEKQLITYPRTNTEYLATNEKDKICQIFKNYPSINLSIENSKNFDDSKIESHSALTITNKVAGELTGIEKTVYDTIFNRFISNFLAEETTISKTTIEIIVSSQKFELKGEVIENEGFLKYEPQKLNNNLPNLKKGQTFSVDFKALEKETVPPSKLTETTLSNFLKNPYKKYEILNEEEEYKAILEGIEIGTEATRTGIIAKCLSKNYISRKGQSFSITEEGKTLIESVKKLKIDLFIDRNIEISKMLKSVFKGNLTLKEIIKTIENEIQNTINQGIELEQFKEIKEVIGKCPKCGSDIYEGVTKNKIKNYYCSSYKTCDFKLWETTRHFKNEIKITKAKAKALLKENGKAKFKIKDKETYLSLVINGKWVNFKEV